MQDEYFCRGCSGSGELPADGEGYRQDTRRRTLIGQDVMTETTTSTPHDAVFKTFMTHPETARDFLAIHLPAPLRAQCDLSTLQLESSSFIDEELKETHSDVLWSVNTAQGKGYVYALVEHQSTAQKNMTFRLMYYAFSAMHRHLKNVDNQLPLVIPILFYHGERSPYPYSMRWWEAFSHPALAKQLYFEALPLVDITVLSDDEIATHRRMAVLEFLQKHIRRRDLLELTDALARLLAPGYTTQSQFDAMMSYIAQAGHSASLFVFFRRLARKVPQHKETLMTIAEWMEKEREKGIDFGRRLGMNKGRREGIKDGLRRGLDKGQREGERNAKRQIAQALLATGIDVAIIAKTTGLTVAEIEALA